MWENGKIEGSQFLGSVWQPQRTIKLQPKEIEIYDNLINNALCMTPFRTMLKHNTFRDRIQMTADIFVLCFIKRRSPWKLTTALHSIVLGWTTFTSSSSSKAGWISIRGHDPQSTAIVTLPKSDVNQNKWISEIRHLIQLPFSRILIWLLVLGCLKVLDDSQAPCNECQNSWIREPD